MHRPGRPEDLPPAETLWARWALLAAVTATAADEARASGQRNGIWLDAEGLHLDDCGSTWWTMSRRGDGRFVLYGEDESSGVKWHAPPIDMLAGAPDWLPCDELNDLLEGRELGCVYWFENGAWARASYPDSLADDGLDCGISRFVDRQDVLWELNRRIARTPDGPSADELLSAAETYQLPLDLLDRLRPAEPGDDSPDPAVVRRLLAAARLTAPSI